MKWILVDWTWDVPRACSSYWLEVGRWANSRSFSIPSIHWRGWRVNKRIVLEGLNNSLCSPFWVGPEWDLKGFCDFRANDPVKNISRAPVWFPRMRATPPHHGACMRWPRLLLCIMLRGGVAALQYPPSSRRLGICVVKSAVWTGLKLAWNHLTWLWFSPFT